MQVGGAAKLRQPVGKCWCFVFALAWVVICGSVILHQHRCLMQHTQRWGCCGVSNFHIFFYFMQINSLKVAEEMRPVFAVCWNGSCKFRFLSPAFSLFLSFFDTLCTDTLKFVCKGWLAGLWSKRKRGRHIHVGRKYCGGTSIFLPLSRVMQACLVGRGVGWWWGLWAEQHAEIQREALKTKTMCSCVWP